MVRHLPIPSVAVITNLKASASNTIGSIKGILLSWRTPATLLFCFETSLKSLTFINLVVDNTGEVNGNEKNDIGMVVSP
ncbi:hypothetical protein PanWU01x14_023750 [Parasponia andersonii]|uniref:Uncharacterized protein n=1 Tax=Parasponia andersonii TaxID=3476 RepID=A0A2P5DXK2_PARAD|nr:hypothetical protein PanWU01x14_023750 [Parasponia andersonii]